MASPIDYYAIEEAVQTLLVGFTGLRPQDGVQVLVEEDLLEVMGAIDNGAIVMIYLDDRVPSEQPIAGRPKDAHADRALDLVRCCLGRKFQGSRAFARCPDGAGRGRLDDQPHAEQPDWRSSSWGAVNSIGKASGNKRIPRDGRSEAHLRGNRINSLKEST
jgi:hypothetical protein